MSHRGAIGSSPVANGASVKSFRPKDSSGDPLEPGRNGERDFHGEKRSNQTHALTSDPEARLYRKGTGQPAKLAFMEHALMENRYALGVDGWLSAATGSKTPRDCGHMVINEGPAHADDASSRALTTSLRCSSVR